MFAATAILVFFSLVSVNVQAKTQIAPLKISDTAYEIDRPENAPLVVMIHEVSGPLSIWDNTFYQFVDQESHLPQDKRPELTNPSLKNFLLQENE